MVSKRVNAVPLDNFNARDMTASECAETFVDLSSFRKLRGNSNSLLIGPRGSGKTTLLKMLTPEGIEKWRRATDEEPDSRRLNFTGVHVPLDVQLSDLFENLKKSGLSDEIVKNGIESIFSLHVFRCVANSISWLCGSEKRHSGERVLDSLEESGLVRELALLWSVDVEVPTMGQLSFELRLAQIRLIDAWRGMVLGSGIHQKLPTQLEEVVSLDSRLKAAIESLSRHVSWLPKRWCVLFDEVELAPSELQTTILSYLRHSDETIFFKVAISPYMNGFRGIREGAHASASNDYVPIDLLSFSPDEMREFSSRFFSSSAERAGLGSLEMQTSLGPSVLNPIHQSHDLAKAYARETLQTKSFESLAKKDPSFRAYLGDTISLSDIALSGDSDERGPFRKARQVALLRDAFLSVAETSGRATKTRNNSRNLFTGAETIVRMCEGNPRRLAFMVPLLLSNVDPKGKVSRNAQIAAVGKTEAAFRSFLRGLPVSPELGGVLNRGVLSFIDMLGNLYHVNIVADQFSDDPVASFIVHSSASPLVEELMARCVNSGALLQLSDSDQRGVSTVQDQTGYMLSSKGKRFRLSYMLSPGYGLMTRIGRSNSLHTLLGEWDERGSVRQKNLAAALLNDQLRLL